MPGQRSVLVVDDNADFLSVLVDALTMLGFAVTGVSRPDEAGDALRQGGAFDVLVLDMHLSADTSGPDLAAEARRVSPGLPVIFLTGDPSAAAEAGLADIGPVVAKTDGIMAVHAALMAV